MDRKELRGLFKGLGIGIILSSALFYSILLNMRVECEDRLTDQTYLTDQARDLGMVFPTEELKNHQMSDEAIIEAARKLGMSFEDKE